MRRASYLLGLSVLAVTGPIHAFNAWGFRSGMSESQVAAIATAQGYEALPPTDVTTHFENVAFLQHSPDGQITGYIASFCRDRLTWLALTYKPSVGALIDVLKSLMPEYGTPEAFATTQVASGGLVRSLDFRFAPRHNDTTGVNVVSDPDSSTVFALQVTHDVYATAVPCR